MDDHYIHNSHEVETMQMTINPRRKCKGILICSLKKKKNQETGANAPVQIWPQLTRSLGISGCLRTCMVD